MNSGAGCIANSLSSDRPRKNAVLISNDWSFQCNELIVWRISVLPSRDNVGLSVDARPTSGSWNPRITKRAFGFLPEGWLASSFHVNTHFDDIIRSGCILSLSNGSTALVSIQHFSSRFFACSNCFFSSSVRVLYCTSVWVFLAARFKRWFFHSKLWLLGAHLLFACLPYSVPTPSKTNLVRLGEGNQVTRSHTVKESFINTQIVPNSTPERPSSLWKEVENVEWTVANTRP